MTYSNNGTSEAVMRNQFRAWSQYMTDGATPGAALDAEGR